MSVSIPHPPARLASRAAPAHAPPPPSHARPLLSTTRHPPPLAFGRRHGLKMVDFGRCGKVRFGSLAPPPPPLTLTALLLPPWVAAHLAQLLGAPPLPFWTPSPPSPRGPCSRAQVPTRARREAEEDPKTPPRAPRQQPPANSAPAGACTTPTFTPSPITQISLPSHLHPHNPFPPPLLAPSHHPPPPIPMQPRPAAAWRLFCGGSLFMIVVKLIIYISRAW